MTVIAGAIHFVAGMFEFLPGGRNLQKLGGVALRNNGVAGSAIAGGNLFAQSNCGMVAVVAAETTGPIFMANIFRIGAPIRFHFRKEILPV